MTYEQAISHYGTQARLAAVLGITQPTVSAWKRVIPPRYQFQLEVLSGGILQADKALRKPPGDIQHAAFVRPRKQMEQLVADDRKRVENVCCKVTEQMAVDIARLLAVDDMKLSAWLYGLIRRELYGRSRRTDPATSDTDSD